MATATIRVYGIRAATDGSDNVIASIEAFYVGKPIPGYAGDVVMSAAQFTAIWQQATAALKIAKFLETVGLLDNRFTAVSIAAFLEQRAAATAAIAGATALSFPLDLAITV